MLSGPRYRDRQTHIADTQLNESHEDDSSYSNFEPLSSFRRTQDGLQDLSFPSNMDPVPIHEPTIHERENNSITLFDDALPFSGPSHFICDECKEMFKYEYDFANHRCKHTKEISSEVFKQTRCKKDRPKRRNVIRTSKKPEKYDEGVETQAQESVTIQNSIHTNEVLFCNICGKSFSSSNELLKHKKSCAVSSKDKQYTCDYSDKFYKYESDLVRHSLIHTAEKPHKCDKCGKSFSTKKYLKKHEKRCGSTDKEYACEECHMKYRQKQNLETHYRKHTGERPFKCVKCGKSFSNPGSFSRHKKTCGCSPEDRPYECNKCNKKFTQKSTFVNHSEIHNDVKLYQCEMCGQKFSTKLYLRRHKKKCGCSLERKQ